MATEQEDVTAGDVTAGGVSVEIVGDVDAIMRAFLGSPEARRQLQQDVAALDELVGCQAHEVTEIYGEQYGSLTIRDIAAQKEAGLSGRDALDAALLQKHPHHGTEAIPPASASAHRSNRRADVCVQPRQRTRRTRRQSAARGSPGRQGRQDDPEPEPLAVRAARRCETCGRDIGHRRRDARFCERAGCRQASSRLARATDPDLVNGFRDLCWTACLRGILTPEEALINSIFLPPEKVERLRRTVAA